MGKSGKGTDEMVKRIIACVLCLNIMLSAAVYAENVSDSSGGAPWQEQTMPPERGQGGRGGGGGRPGGMGAPQMNGDFTAGSDGDFGNRENPRGMRGEFSENMSDRGTDAESGSSPMTFAGFLKEYSTPVTSVVLLALAFVFVIFYKRKRY